MVETTQHSTDFIVGMADIKTGKSPDFLVTNLGSCVAVCLYSEKHQAGGILHLMMATIGPNANKPDLKKAKYADTGIPELFRLLKINYGIQVIDCKAKIFGGGKILKNVTNQIGFQNEEESRKILQKYGVPIIAAKTGGEKGYKVRLNLNTGKVLCQIFGSQPEEF